MRPCLPPLCHHLSVCVCEREREAPFLALSCLERKMWAGAFNAFSPDITTPLMWDALTSPASPSFSRSPSLSLFLARQEQFSPTTLLCGGEREGQNSHTNKQAKQASLLFLPPYSSSSTVFSLFPLLIRGRVGRGRVGSQFFPITPLHLSNDKDNDKASGARSMGIAKGRTGLGLARAS
jgi:hypothetical protein